MPDSFYSVTERTHRIVLFLTKSERRPLISFTAIEKRAGLPPQTLRTLLKELKPFDDEDQLSSLEEALEWVGYVAHDEAPFRLLFPGSLDD